jgi:hypothetical protein
MLSRLLVLLGLFLAAPVFAHPAPVASEVAPGIWLFRTQPYGDVGLDGNSVAIVSREGVLVFDANGTPDAARAGSRPFENHAAPGALPRVLALALGSLVRRRGLQGCISGLVVISHEKRALMAGPAIAFNQPGLDEQLPAHIAEVDSELTRSAPGSAEAKSPPSISPPTARFSVKTRFPPDARDDHVCGFAHDPPGRAHHPARPPRPSDHARRHVSLAATGEDRRRGRP